MKIATTVTCVLLLMLICVSTAGQIAIVKNGKPQSRLVIDSSVDADNKAANLMNFFIQRITGTKLPIVEANQKIKNGDIIIGDYQSSATFLFTDLGFGIWLM